MRHLLHDCNTLPRCDRPIRQTVVWFSTFLLLCAGSAGAKAQAEPREVGTMIASGNVIWVLATDSGTVQLFMSRGYRDALARPMVLNAQQLAAWTDSVGALKRPSTGLVEMRMAASDGTGPMLIRWLSPDSAGLRIEEDSTTVVRLGETSARQLVDLLAQATQRTSQLSGQSVTPDVNPAAASAPTTSVARAAERLDSAILAPVSQPEQAVDTASALPVRVPSLEPSLDQTIPRDAAPAQVDLAASRGPAAVAVNAAPPPQLTLADKHIQTPLGPFVVPGAKLVDRDTQINYCYTELGLRYDRRLTGEVTVRVNLSAAGVADTVEVTKRTWDGVAAAEVESCMRALIEDWSFSADSTLQPRTIELHFALAPTTGIRAVAANAPDPAAAPPR